jgi:hypothetical protein
LKIDYEISLILLFFILSFRPEADNDNAVSLMKVVLRALVGTQIPAVAQDVAKYNADLHEDFVHEKRMKN